MRSISVKFAGFGGSNDVELTLHEGQEPTVADARQAANVDDNLDIRVDGQRLDREAEAATPVQDQAVLTTLAPEAKQGR